MPPGLPIDPSTLPPPVPLAPPVQIILTAAEADQVRGLTQEGHALAPSPLNDGTFVLPMAVLDDPAHASVKDTLLKATNPPRSVDPTEFMGYQADAGPGNRVPLDPAIQAVLDDCSFKTDWEVAKPVALDTAVLSAAVSVVAAEAAAAAQPAKVG